MELDIKSYKRLKDYMSDKAVSELWIRRFNARINARIKKIQEDSHKKV